MGRLTRQIEAAWHDAPRRIAELARRGDRERPGVVGITGAPGCGKTTLAERVAAAAPGSVLIATDRYLPDYDKLDRSEYDNPEHADLYLLVRNLTAARRREHAELPVWSFETHRREGYEPLDPPAPGSLIVVEGIFALASPVRDALDVGVFVDAPPDLREERVVARELAGERGWTPDEAASFLAEVADPTFRARAEVYRRAADVLVMNDGPLGPPNG